jgi:hypothetical protein
MDAIPPSTPGGDVRPNAAPTGDPALQPSTNYGTLGPGSDIAAGLNTASGSTGNAPPRRSNPARVAPIVSVVMGVFFAVLVVSIGSAHAAWSRFTNLFAVDVEVAPPPAPKDVQDLDHLRPQKQAETLLEQAVGRSDSANDQISSRVDRWQGKLKWDSQIATLTTAALNSSDMRVRESGIEVELAAYGLAKNSASLEYLLTTAESTDHAKKIWALWALGLMGNRGVATDRVVEVLTAHLKDSDQDSRQWAVEGLSLVGTNQVIDPLLQTLRSDASHAVRERAACGLAESGMFTREQRLSAIPQLLNDADDPEVDTQTRTWVFQALADITRQRLPNDPAAWRAWYQNQN